MVPGLSPGPQVTPHDEPVVRPSLHAMAPKRRIGRDTVDLEAVDGVDRRHLLRIELDDRVVEALVAGDHGAEHPAVRCGLGATWAPGPPQCADVKPMSFPRLSWPMVVSVQSDVTVDDDPRTTAERHGVLGVGDRRRRETGGTDRRAGRGPPNRRPP